MSFSRVLGAIGVLAVLGVSGFLLVTHPAAFDAVRGRSFNLSGAPDLDNGRNLFWAGGCASCHASENQPDRTRLGGGHALASPFGTFHVPNISPHPRDGIGGWTAAQFARAMVQGVSPDGRHYYPAFPYTSYQRMTDRDLRDLHGFMMTLPAVEGRIRDHDLPFPFNIRLTLGGWKWLFLDGKPFEPDPTKTADINRGRYLADGAGHCAECHSPRNPLGGIQSGKMYAGGPDPGGKGWVPNLTPHATGIGDAAKASIVSVLTTGMKDDGDFVGGSMGSVTKNWAEVKKSDVEAVASFLKSLPPIENARPAR
jgi:mono/diheme cytochrome c family protein